MFLIQIARNLVVPHPTLGNENVKARSDKAAGDFQKYFEVGNIGIRRGL